MSEIASSAAQSKGAPGRPLKIFLVAGEHSGDALGGKLMAALRGLHPGEIAFSGVGGDEMSAQGLASLFSIDDVAVMGPIAILKALPLLVRRVHQTVDHALRTNPDLVIIIDSPEFTHPIAKRIRRRAPLIPIIDYVSPSVWAWRPGRAKRMRTYIDHVLALLPFEPDAHARLGGPPCSYVGHPLIEKLDDIATADGRALAARLGLVPGIPILLVLPGSRRSEIERLSDIFGEAVARVETSGQMVQVVIPAVKRQRERIAEKTGQWRKPPTIIEADDPDKYAAMRLATAALAASGTVTLELALAGCPSVVAYRTDSVSAKFIFLIKVSSVVLANLVLGKNVYPEFIQDRCTAPLLADALLPLLSDTAARIEQLEALAHTPSKLNLEGESPSSAAARTVLAFLAGQKGQAGNSRRAGPT